MFFKDGRKEDDDTFCNFNFVSGFNNHSVDEENSSWIQMKLLRLPDKVLKYTCRGW